MSTKIYNGMMYPYTSFSEIDSYISETVKPLVYDRHKHVCLNFLSTISENKKIDPRERWEQYWIKNYNNDELFIKIIDDKTLILPYGQLLIETINEHQLFNEYAYWDNTDEPDNYDPADWDSRRMDWEKVYIPSQDMYGRKLSPPFNPYYFFSTDEKFKEDIKEIRKQYKW